MEPTNNLELPRSGGQIEDFNHHGYDGGFDFPNKIEIPNIEKKEIDIDSDSHGIDVRSSHYQQIPNIDVSPVAHGGSGVVSTPGKAMDKDLIEDEWVKDLIDMIRSTKGDPHLRESKFKQMQVDYMKKRYNRIINSGK